MKLQGGDIDVSAGTGFRGKEPVALVRLTVTPTGGEPVVVFMRPLEARGVGLDLIGAGLIAMMRAVTDEELGEG